jgi:hypothetical protein
MALDVRRLMGMLRSPVRAQTGRAPCVAWRVNVKIKLADQPGKAGAGIALNGYLRPGVRCIEAVVECQPVLVKHRPRLLGPTVFDTGGVAACATEQAQILRARGPDRIHGFRYFLDARQSAGDDDRLPRCRDPLQQRDERVLERRDLVARHVVGFEK